jgi:hypothetical protein
MLVGRRDIETGPIAGCRMAFIIDTERIDDAPPFIPG